MRTFLIATLLAASTTALHAQAEAAADLQPGARVRVAVPLRSEGRVITATRGWTVGTVQSIDRQFIVLRVQRPEGLMEEQIPFDVIKSVEVSRGIVSDEDAQRRGAIRGGKIGVAVGAGATAFLYLASKGFERIDSEFDESVECTGACSFLELTPLNAVRNVAVGGGLGALLGGVFGSRAREVWVPTQKPRVDLRSRAGGGTAVSLNFAL